MTNFESIDPILKSWAAAHSLRLETEQWQAELRRFCLSTGIEKNNSLYVSKSTTIGIEKLFFLIKVSVFCSTHPQRSVTSYKVLWTRKHKLYQTLNGALEIAKDWLGEDALNSKWNKTK